MIGEPYFQPSILPWHNLHFWYVLSKLPVSLKYIPQSMKIYAVAMEFKDLSKIRSPVNFCEGFCLEEFDELIEVSFCWVLLRFYLIYNISFKGFSLASIYSSFPALLMHFFLYSSFGIFSKFQLLINKLFI